MHLLPYSHNVWTFLVEFHAVKMCHVNIAGQRRVLYWLEINCYGQKYHQIYRFKLLTTEWFYLMNMAANCKIRKSGIMPVGFLGL